MQQPQQNPQNDQIQQGQTPTVQAPNRKNIQILKGSNTQQKINIEFSKQQDHQNSSNTQPTVQQPSQQTQEELKQPDHQSVSQQNVPQQNISQQTLFQLNTNHQGSIQINQSYITQQNSYQQGITSQLSFQQNSNPTKNLSITKRSSASIVIENKKGEVIKMEKKDDQQLPLQTTPIHPSSSEISVEKPQNKGVDIDLNKQLDVYDVNTLLSQKDNESLNKRVPQNRGYVTLQNYLLEMKNDRSGKPQYPYSKPQRSKSKQNIANLIEKSGEGFVPTVLLKNVDMWDNKSDQAFKMNVNQSFNKLTKERISQILTDLVPHINSPEREKIVVDIFVKKASSEKGFASTYAEFAKELAKNNQSLSKTIIDFVTDKLEDYALNPAEEQNDYECESSIGYTTFVAALISSGCIQDGERYLKIIIDAIPDGPINPTLIEMLKNFVLSVGNSFIKTVDRKIWEKLDNVLERKDIQSRVRYLIIDTLEIIHGTKVEQEKVQKVTESSKSLVRNGFASFQEDYSIIPNEVQSMKSAVFFEGSMILFPDIKDIYDFTYYQCFVIKKNEYKKNEIINILQQYIRSFAEQKLEMDVRHIWINISTLLCQMIIQGIINPKEAQYLHSQIYYSPSDPTPNDPWDPYNDLKFFILDNIDFSEPIEISSNFNDQEIIDALKMPLTINNASEIKKVSRLIAIAAVRSVFAQFRAENRQNIADLNRWKGILSSVNKKMNKAVRETLEEDFKDYEYAFTVDDVIKYIS